MKRLQNRFFIVIFWITIIITLPTLPARASQPVQLGTPLPRINITFPLPGEALRGKVFIQGSSQVRNFQRAMIEFSYMENPTGTWFLIHQFVEQPNNSTLAEWDTTLITDGIYTLRLSVMTKDGTSESILVDNLRVRNYSIVETETPAPTFEAIKQTPHTDQIEPTQIDIDSTPTHLPQNPLIYSNQDISKYFASGALITVILFIVLGIYFLAQRR